MEKVILSYHVLILNSEMGLLLRIDWPDFDFRSEKAAFKNLKTGMRYVFYKRDNEYPKMKKSALSLWSS